MGTLILGDPHLGKSTSLGKPGIGAIANSRILDQLDLLEWVLQQAIRLRLDHIIITGDVFEDPKPATSLITMFVAWLKRCDDNDIDVHIIQGNHDILRTGATNTSSLDVVIESQLSNVAVYKDIATVFVGDTAFTMVPFRDRKSFNLGSNTEAIEHIATNIAYEAASIPNYYRKILVGHLALNGAIYVGDEVDDIANELICPLSMFKSYDYVWMGHVHKPQILQAKTAKTPLIAHIGSMDISNYAETNEIKHVIVIDGDSITSIPLPTRPLKKFAIAVPENTPDTTKFVLDHILEQGSVSRAIIRVEAQLTVPDLLPIDRRALEKALYNAGAFNISAIVESKKPAVIKKDDNPLTTTMDVPSTIKSWILSRVPQDKQAKVLSLAFDCHKEFQTR